MTSPRTSEYASQAARDACAQGYGDRAYWEYLDASALRSSDYWTRRGDACTARAMLIRSLSDALRGNDGI